MFLLALAASAAAGAALCLILAGGWRVIVMLVAEWRSDAAMQYRSWAAGLGLDWDETRIRWEAQKDVRNALIALLATLALLPFLNPFQVIFVGILSTLGAYLIPKWRLRRRAERKWARFDEDLPDALQVMVQAMRAGESLIQSVQRAAERIPGPVREEFELLRREYSRSLSLGEVLARARERIPSDGFRMVSSALILGAAQGGDLLEVLQRLSESIRALTRLQRRIYIETTEVRMQEKVAIWITPAFAVLVILFEPGNVHFLLSTARGFAVIAIVITLQVVGAYLIRSIVRTTI